MPADVSYSLFPASEETLLKRRNSRLQRSRSRSRSRTPGVQQSSTLPKRSTSLRVRPCKNEEDEEPTPIEQDEAVMSGALLGSAPRPSKDAILTRTNSPPPAVPIMNPRRTASARGRQATQHTRAPSAPPDRPLPQAPVASAGAKSHSRTGSDSISESNLRPMIEAYCRHTRNLTNNTISSGSTATTAFKASPVTPLSDTASLFSPITPASGRTSVSYPVVPKLSSSPAMSISGGWSPPRRSNTRTTERTDWTGPTTYSLAQNEAANFGEFRSQTVPAGVSRSPSLATTFVERRRPEDAAPANVPRDEHSPSRSLQAKTAPPFQSIFPQYDHDLPYAKQNYVPNYARLQGFNNHPHEPPERSTTPRTQATSPPPALQHPQHLPPRSKSTGVDQIMPSQGPPERFQLSDIPKFDPPPRRATAPNIGTRRQRSESVPKPPKPSKPKAVLKKNRPSQTNLKNGSKPTVESATKAAVANAAASARAANNAADSSDIDDSISDDERVELLPQRSGTLTKDTYKVSRLLQANPSLHKVIVEPREAAPKAKPAKETKDQAKEVTKATQAPVHASDTTEDASGLPDGVQHSAAVALGALTFVMGVGVEVVGGAVGGLKRKPRQKG